MDIHKDLNKLKNFGIVVSLMLLAGCLTNGSMQWSSTGKNNFQNIVFSATSLNFGNIISGNSTSQTITVTNVGNISATSLSFSSFRSGSGFSFQGGGTTCTTTLAAGASCQLSILFYPPSINSFSDSISLSADFGSVHTTSMPLNFSGVGAPQAPISFSYTVSNPTYLQGLAITANTVSTHSGGLPTSYVLSSGSLPVGLNLDPNSGSISGTPTAVASSSVTITGSNVSGSVPLNMSFVIQLNFVANSIGVTSASTGTCSASGPSSVWCSGGTFAASLVDGGLNTPNSIAVDQSGYSYVLDSGNHRISKFNPNGSYVGSIGYKSTGSTGTCASVAGYTLNGWCTGGSFSSNSVDGAMFSPSDIAVDNSGNLYVSDTGNHRINRYNSSGLYSGSLGYKTSGTAVVAVTSASPSPCPSPSGFTNSWCGGGTFGTGSGDGMLNSPKGITLNNSGSILYVADASNNRLSQYSMTNGTYTGSIGYKSTGSAGTCSSGSGATSAWCTGGTFVSGSGDGGFSIPTRLYYDTSTTKLFVADTSNHRVSIYTQAGAYGGSIGMTSTAGNTCGSSSFPSSGWCTGATFTSDTSGGSFSSPKGLLTDSSGNLYVIADSSRITKYNSYGQYIGTIGNKGLGSGTCQNTAGFTSGGWCTTSASFSTGTGDGMFNGPLGMALDLNGYFYFADSVNNRIQRIIP